MHDAEEVPAASDLPAAPSTPPIPTQRTVPGPWSEPPGTPAPSAWSAAPSAWSPDSGARFPDSGAWFPGPGPAIPGQRAPLPGELFPSTHPLPPAPVEVGDLPPLMLAPGTSPLPLPPLRRRGRNLLIGAGLTLAAVLAVGAGAVYVDRAPLALDERAAAAGPEPTAAQPPRTPAEAADAALEAQATALLAGDEQGWLAAVDPGQAKLRARYRSMFRSLRGLGVSHFAYHTSIDPVDAKSATVEVTADAEYCFSTDKCPEEKDNVSDGPPTVTHNLTFKKVGARYVISKLITAKSRDLQEPTPWETGDDLVLLSGKRVTVAGDRRERRYFKQVLAAAEKAAAVNDRFAALVRNPQQKYRVYVAGAEQWKTWYGGITDKWVIGYAMPLNDSGSDVVLNISAVRTDSQVLATTIQHELAHVVTLGGAYRTSGGSGDMWLEEGIAEYIGWYPRSATDSWRRSAVRSLLSSGKRPKSIAARAPGDDAGPGASDAFYGLGHFTADCMARKYGQGALFDFVRLYLRENRDLDPASREAFGKPFATVDKTCMAWIRDKV